MNDIYNDYDVPGIVPQQVADHAIVADAQLPESCQIFPVGYEALFGIVDLGQTSMPMRN